MTHDARLQPEIIERTPEYVVVSKPAGLLVHPADSSPGEYTMADWLLETFPEVAVVGDEPGMRPGIMHRLDREASGLMVIALTQPSFESLKLQFQEREITKEYLVLVHGQVKNDYGEINLPISRATRGGRMAAHGTGNVEANEARTEYFIERRFGNVTLLRVHILTGRTHQIRVHMFALQHPVVGDSLYSVKKVGKSFPTAPRLFLHSAKLGFTALNGERKEYSLPLPPELSAYLTQFKTIL